MPLRIAVLVKQIPHFEAMELGPDGRLVREGLELELNPYCRRAVSKGVELARQTGGTCTVFTLGPAMADDVLREAIAWGADDGVLVSDPAFAGSDTIATAKALAAVLRRSGPFDLVLAGRNSVDADTGQVGPQVAELLDLPFATGVKRLQLGDDGCVAVLCEEDDGQSERLVRLPAVLSCAERLCEPAKVDPEGRAAVAASLIRVVTAADLGPGPWGQDGSGTYVGEVRVLDIARDRHILSGPVAAQVDEAVRLLRKRDALALPTRSGSKNSAPQGTFSLPEGVGGAGPVVAVLVEPGRVALVRELLGAATRLASEIGGRVVAVGPSPLDARELAMWGADRIVALDGAVVEEDVATAVAGWAEGVAPWGMLAPSTTWGREVAARASARLGAGLTGDAVDVEVTRVASSGEAQLLAWKPAFGGRLVAAVYASTPIQMVTVRAGVVQPIAAGGSSADDAIDLDVDVEHIAVAPRGRVTIERTVRDDDLDALATADRVVAVGAGVDPSEYGTIETLLEVLGAELAATRKVTDNAWLPRARQVGITGRSIAPTLAVIVGASGKFNHMVGYRAAGTVLAVNPDPEAPIWDHADVGIVADWHDVVPLLVARLREDRNE